MQEHISIHAPAKGATSVLYLSLMVLIYFNSRPREGGDGRGRHRRVSGRRISIHAPAKGATYNAEKKNYLRTISIHAPAKGATMLWFACPFPCNFNSRPREGGDAKGELGT